MEFPERCFDIDRKAWGVLLAVLVVASLAVAVFYEVLFPPMSIISVSNIYVQPQGREVSGEWTGSFWVIVMSADMSDTVAGYKFEEGQEGYVGDKRLQTTATIEVRIDPEQPYYVRQMEVASVEMAPECYGGYQNKLSFLTLGKTGTHVDRVLTDHYEFTTDSRWQKFTPFTVTILKDGVEIDSQTINTEGGSKVISFNTGEGVVSFNNLGTLSGRYGDPQFGDMLYFSDDWMFQADTLSRILIESAFPTETTGGSGDIGLIQYDSYAHYWYGVYYWGDDGTPAPFTGTGLTINDPSLFGGWVLADDALNYVRNPVAPVVFPGDMPSQATGFKSLVEFLEYKGVNRIQTGAYPKVFKRADNKLETDVPFDALNEGSSMFTILIPTELADTIVWHPQVANVQIADWFIPTQLGERFSGWIKLKQESTVRSTGHVSISFDPSTAPISVTPNDFDITLDPNEMDIQTLEFLNAGTDTEIDVTMTVTVTDSLGIKTDSKTAQIKLLKRTGSSLLMVYTIDKETLEPLGGIPVTVAWDTQSKTAVTSGGESTFDMGSYLGSVSVVSAETAMYRATSATKQLTAGPNSVTLKLEKHTYVPPPWWEEYWWLFVVIIAAVIIIIILIVIWRKK